MKLETLSGLIVQLVLENGRVMLPQLGAFMRETVPASFSDRGFTLLPPYRRLVFRESQGDGTLLCEALSRQARLTPQRAQAEIEACVQALREQLEEENQALIPGLGRLKRTASGGLLFVQDEDLDVSGELMALDAVSLKSQNRLAAAAFHMASEPVAPKPAPVPVAPASASASASEPEPVPASEPEPVAPAPMLEPESASASASEPEPAVAPVEPAPVSGPDSAPVDPAPASEPVAPAQTYVPKPAEPDPASAPTSEPPAPPVMRDIPANGEEEAEERHTSPWLVLLLVVLALVLLFFALFYAGVWFFPDTLDKFLYDEQQLELLKYFGLTR
ncbi:MAG: hypothetical protein K5651_05100 [Bacteroidales bacterium]|nr:hypothetical protein [Bacteroidales bacterium]